MHGSTGQSTACLGQPRFPQEREKERDCLKGSACHVTCNPKTGTAPSQHPKHTDEIILFASDSSPNSFLSCRRRVLLLLLLWGSSPIVPSQVSGFSHLALTVDFLETRSDDEDNVET